MKQFLKILGIVLGILILAIAGTAAWIGLTDVPTHPVKNLPIQLPTDSMSLAHGAKIAKTLCGYCHMNDDGNLAGDLFLPKSEGFGEWWSGNLTKHPDGLGRYEDGEIAYLLRTGIKKDGKLAGPFMLFPNISDEDMAAIIAFLRSDAPEVQPVETKHRTSYSFLSKALLKLGALKPLPFEEKAHPTPPASDQVAYGRYLATSRYECASCHSASFETYNVLDPEQSPGFFAGGNPISDPEFNPIPSRNITPHPDHGIGKWTAEQFRMAIKSGIRPDGKALSAAMPRFAVLDEEEVNAIWAYLQTVPPMETTVAKAGH